MNSARRHVQSSLEAIWPNCLQTSHVFSRNTEITLKNSQRSSVCALAKKNARVHPYLLFQSQAMCILRLITRLT